MDTIIAHNKHLVPCFNKICMKHVYVDKFTTEGQFNQEYSTIQIGQYALLVFRS
jgi:hypothetical protein